MTESPVEHVRRINGTWIVHGNLAEDTRRYLAVLEEHQPELLSQVCERALAAARKASKEQRDPKPDFYAELFRHATAQERESFLNDHPWTRMLLDKMHES